MHSTQTISQLFSAAGDDGVLGNASEQILNAGINTQVIAGASGKSAEQIDATEMTLVTLIIDDSGSISYSGLAKGVRDGQNSIVQALQQAKQEIMLAQWKLGHHSEVVHAYIPVEQATIFDRKNYDPAAGTALYDVWMDAVAANIAYAQTLEANGVPVTSVILMITDGEDQHSKQYRASDCAKINQDLLASEMYHLAFIGVGDPQYFRQIAKEMGFPDQAVLLADASNSAIRKAAGLASQSIIRASQGLIQPGGNQGFFNSP